MNEYSIGLACGIIFGVLFLVIWFAFRKAKGIDPMEKFDERQIADRYKAYKSGFFALLIFVAADALLKMFGVSLFEEPVGECIAVFIAVGVFACRAVMSDAYFAPGKSMRNFILLYGVICFAQLLNTVKRRSDHEESEAEIREGGKGLLPAAARGPCRGLPADDQCDREGGLQSHDPALPCDLQGT